MKPSQAESFQTLRQRAEKMIRPDEDCSEAVEQATTQELLSHEETSRLLHELQVHQIELEIQNNELRRSQDELETSRERYFELFDMAPIGYLTLDNQGKILEANLTLSTLLGVARGALLNKPLSRYILPEDRNDCFLQRKQLDEVVIQRQGELRMVRADGSSFWVELTVLPMQNDEFWVVLEDIDRRKQMEESLNHQSRQMIQLILDNIPQHIFWKDRDSVYLGCNQHFAEDAGLENPQQIIGKTDFDLPWNDQADRYRKIDRFVMEADRPKMQYDESFRCADGNVLFISATKVPLHDLQGNVTGVLGTYENITDRKQAEGALRESEARYQAIIEDQTDLICRYLPDGRLSFVNMAYLRYFGKKRDELINRNFIPHIPEPDLTTILEQFKGITPGSPIVNVEHRVIMPDGTIRWQQWVHRGIYSPEGTIIENQAVGRDITERKQAELDRKLNDKRLQLLLKLNTMTEATEGEILGFALEATLATVQSQFGFIGFMDDADAIMTVRTWSKDVLAQCTIDFAHLDVPIAEDGLWSECVRQRIPILINDYDAPHPHKNGCPAGHVPIKRFLAIPVFDNDRIVAVAAAANKAEAYTQSDANAFTALMERVFGLLLRKRTAEELLQAKNAADDANQAKSAFLATMSHEIRTPLSALLGNVELLNNSPLSPQQQNYLKDCKNASRMLLQVINDVLDFSKIEAGKLELINETFSVSSMARQLVRIFAISAEQKGIDLNLLLAKDLPACISGDQHRLRQIISNLLSNAVKHTSHGTVSLEIVKEQSSSNPSPDTVVLLISVRDTGTGIPLDKQVLIFESFTQVESFSTRRNAGTGLGLAICRRLSEIMGGTISLSSAPGEGSVFTVSLPVTVCQAPPQQVRAKRTNPQDAIPRNILLADDDDLGRTMIAALLQRQGHRVTEVGNGESLLEALQRQRFDIVLSDISMPDMDGTDAARIIRSGEHADIDTLIPIIAMTAHAFPQDRNRFLEAGINGYVSKPVDFEDLLRQIDDLCSKAAQTHIPEPEHNGC